jgi:hypothetical protein
MSLIIQIPDLDDSASQLGAIVETVLGFPVSGLQGLYLFEDGTVGSAYAGTGGAATDSSGNGAHAPMLSSSVVNRVTEGVATGASGAQPFAFRTPFAIGGSFSLVLATRNRLAAGTAQSFPTPWLTTINASGGGQAITESFTNANVNTRGFAFINHDSASNVAPSNGHAEIGMQNRNVGNTASWAAAPSGRPAFIDPGSSPKATFTCLAMSMNAATGAIILRFNGTTITWTSLSDLTAWLGDDTAKHLFGMMIGQNLGQVNGDLGAAAFYSVAKSAADLDTLIMATKTRLALRTTGGVPPAVL